jgi:hypothetical protein
MVNTLFRASYKAENSLCYHEEIAGRKKALIVIPDHSAGTLEISVQREMKVGGTQV